MLVRLGVDIVLCLDKDVKKEELEELAERFPDGVPLYYMFDEDNILDEKESPTDDPIKWKHLVENNIYRLRQEGVYLKYKLYENSDNNTSNVLEEVLKNRGVDDYEKYLNLDEDVLIPYENLDNMNKAVELFMKHFNNKDKIEILVDSDPDGFCSAAMMYSYIKKMNADYPVNYILHARAKTHGLDDDIVISDDTKLLIIPDAGTNDTEQCRELSEKGMDILILDHHESEEKNPYA